MKTDLILIRHGYSESNRGDWYTGHTDVALTDVGIMQAEKCAEALAGRRIDALFASDLKRTQQTAAPIARLTGLPVQLRRELREINGGEWEHQPFDQLRKRYPEAYGIWCRDIGRAACPGGESVAEMAARILTAVGKIAEEYAGKTVCIVTHATPLRAICTKAAGLPIEDMAHIPWVRNASINYFTYEDGRLTAVSTDNVDHLGEYATARPSGV